jgi:hypothetical protein
MENNDELYGCRIALAIGAVVIIVLAFVLVAYPSSTAENIDTTPSSVIDFSAVCFQEPGAKGAVFRGCSAEVCWEPGNVFDDETRIVVMQGVTLTITADDGKICVNPPKQGLPGAPPGTLLFGVMTADEN